MVAGQAASSAAARLLARSNSQAQSSSQTTSRAHGRWRSLPVRLLSMGQCLLMPLHSNLLLPWSALHPEHWLDADCFRITKRKRLNRTGFAGDTISSGRCRFGRRHQDHPQRGRHCAGGLAAGSSAGADISLRSALISNGRRCKSAPKVDPTVTPRKPLIY